MAMHTAYYIVGRTKELKESKLIDRKGGLLGLGKTSRLSANVDNTKFTRIDYTQVSNIPVNSTKVKVITSHPSDSYKLEKDAKNKSLVKNLVITNPEKFWATSKYLVIEPKRPSKWKTTLMTKCRRWRILLRQNPVRARETKKMGKEANKTAVRKRLGKPCLSSV
jgi:hypothetical protein